MNGPGPVGPDDDGGQLGTAGGIGGAGKSDLDHGLPLKIHRRAGRGNATTARFHPFASRASYT